MAFSEKLNFNNYSLDKQRSIKKSLDKHRNQTWATYGGVFSCFQGQIFFTNTCFYIFQNFKSYVFVFLTLCNFKTFGGTLWHLTFFLENKDLILLAEMNGILLTKLFWPTVTKIVLVIDKNFWNSWPSASNLQNVWNH